MWTLNVEMAFYVFLPAFVALIHWIGRSRPLVARLRIELWGVAVLVAISLAWRGFVFTALAGSDWAKIAVHWLPGYLDYFALGMAAAVLSAWIAVREKTPRAVELIGRSSGLLWLGALGVFWVAATQLGIPYTGFATITGWTAVARQTLNGVVVFLLLAPGVFGPQDRGLIRGFLRSRPIAYAGLVSYGIYLWHQGWIDKSLEWTGHTPFRAPFLEIAVLTMVFSVITATLSWYLAEAPVLRLKNRPLWRRRRVVPA